MSAEGMAIGDPVGPWMNLSSFVGKTPGLLGLQLSMAVD